MIAAGVNTMKDPSLESATLVATGSTNENEKEVHILFTGVTEKEMQMMEDQLKHVAESKLHIHVGTELKDMENTTHIIASVDRKKQCPRTLKYLNGIVTGKWIVTPQCKVLIDILFFFQKELLLIYAYRVIG